MPRSRSQSGRRDSRNRGFRLVSGSPAPMGDQIDSHKYDYLHCEGSEPNYRKWIAEDFDPGCTCHYCSRINTLSRAVFKFLRRVERRESQGKIVFGREIVL